MNARLIVCENCGKTLAKHCRNHWVSGPHCPGHCKTGEQSWSQPDGGGATFCDECHNPIGCAKYGRRCGGGGAK